MKVLVLDDSKTMLRIITNTLKRVGITDIVTAEDGEEGLSEYNKLKETGVIFDMIFTDWNMPNMNGLQFVKRIRAIDQDTPIVMITTEGGKAEVITALKAGVNNYIVKPFTPAVLKEKITTLIGV